eukprot:6711147-Prymnesium_polylepis.1
MDMSRRASNKEGACIVEHGRASGRDAEAEASRRMRASSVALDAPEFMQIRHFLFRAPGAGASDHESGDNPSATPRGSSRAALSGNVLGRRSGACNRGSGRASRAAIVV